MKVGLVSLGCPKNLVDSEVMLGLAREAGHEITADAARADVVIVNTCAFIDRAKQESVDAILEIAELKKGGSCKRLVVTGCLGERYRDELKADIPEIDVVLGTGEVPAIVHAIAASGGSPLTFYPSKAAAGISQWPEGPHPHGRTNAALPDARDLDPRDALLGDGLRVRPHAHARTDTRSPKFRTPTPEARSPRPGPRVPSLEPRTSNPGPRAPTRSLPSYIYDADTPRVLTTPRHYAYIKIAEGCDYACAFCIIPTLRGAYRSRPAASIVREARELAARGVREILLISQDTTFYGIDRRERGALPALLRQLDTIDGLEWIRLLYLYPTTIDDATIDAVAECDKVCKYIDLPLQHASKAVLRRMKRPGTRQTYTALLERLRARIPGVALRTTFIVGFPGETDDDFAELCAFADEVAFDHVGVFTYSHEDGTSAWSLADDVPARVKRSRQRRLMGLQKRLVRRRQRSQIGTRQRAMVDGPSPEHELVLRARLAAQAPDIDSVVYLTECDPTGFARGEMVEIEIVGARDYDLIGRPV